MKMSVHVEGVSDLIKRLANLGEDAQEMTLDAVEDIALATHRYAVQGILRGPKTGRVYDTRFWTDGQGRLRRGEDRVAHQASAPGEYPANDTGRLASSVAFELPQGDTAIARVGTGIQYGPMLEFGTSKMAARPWLLPSFEKAKAEVEGTLRQRLEAKL